MTLGRDVVIGANSVVTRDLDGFAVTAGSPATVLRHRTPAGETWARSAVKGEL